MEKTERDRTYAAKQKEACLVIYESEGSKWNNVRSWRYDSSADQCFIEYKETEPKTSEQCNEIYKNSDGEIYHGLFRDYINCTNGTFENSF